MSTSIPVLNRNTQLPPLLLPASRSLERCDPFGKRRPRDQGSDEGLEGLAFLATKRPRLDAVTTGPTPSPSPEASCGHDDPYDNEQQQPQQQQHHHHPHDHRHNGLH
ncbi:uncharacterized protein ZBAI_01496 [Zygosaccharomyces bailii ISA1307]|nr:uncharacterized protein ZBAI_01496 [Zygosaccharomyces bailii ISA1307]